MRKHGLAALLLIVVALTHYGYEPLSAFFGGTGYAIRNLFYVLRGLEGVVLFFVVGVLVRRIDVSIVCLWGLVEEGQTAACRIAKGISEPNKAYEAFTGLCGSGVYSLGLFVAGAIAMGLLYELGRSRHGSKRPEGH